MKASNYKSKVNLKAIIGVLIIWVVIIDIFKQEYLEHDPSIFPPTQINFIEKLEKMIKEPPHQDNWVLYEKLSLLYEKKRDYQRALFYSKKSFELREKNDPDW